MIGDTDRPSSSDLEQPATEHGDAVHLCPNPVIDVDKWHTNARGHPSLLNKFAFVWTVFFGLMLLLGDPITPSIMTAIEVDDPLLGLAIVIMSSGIIVLISSFVIETRRTCRSHPDGPLPQLGAGTALLSEKDLHAVLSAKRMFHPRSAVGVGNIWLFCTIHGFLNAVFGWPGLHSTIHNHITGVIHFIFFPLFTMSFDPWLLTLQVATILMRSRINGLIAVANNLKGTSSSVSAEDWDRQLVKPSVELLDKMKIFVAGWSRGVSMFLVLSSMFAISFISLLFMSNAAAGAIFGNNELAQMGFRAFFVFYAIAWCVMGTMVLRIPARVSTLCDDFRDALNNIRIVDRSVETHERLAILEAILSNTNHGKEIHCFQVFFFFFSLSFFLMILNMRCVIGQGIGCELIYIALGIFSTCIYFVTCNLTGVNFGRAIPFLKCLHLFAGLLFWAVPSSTVHLSHALLGVLSGLS